jgi:hypothetical protein
MEQWKKATEPPFFRKNPRGQLPSREPRMIETRGGGGGGRPTKPPIQCWGCGGDHMYRVCPHRGEKVRIFHNIQQDDIVEDMGINVPRIYVSLDNKQDEFQSHMIEVEGKINNQTIDILINSGAIHSYIDLRWWKDCICQEEILENLGWWSWLLELKEKLMKWLRHDPMDMNGLGTRENLNILTLGSYDYLIGMDWLEKYHDILDCYNKEFTCWDEEGNLMIV